MQKSIGTQKFNLGRLSSDSRARDRIIYFGIDDGAREESQKSMMAAVGSATRFISRCRVPAFRYYRRQFFKPQHTAFDIFAFDRPVSRVRRKKAGPCASTRMPCFTTANRAATCVIYSATRSWLEKTYRVVGESNLKKKKEKEKIATPRQEKMRM